jgi:hypothetical protein
VNQTQSVNHTRQFFSISYIFNPSPHFLLEEIRSNYPAFLPVFSSCLSLFTLHLLTW